MEKILFSKYSTERNPEFQIRTDILIDNTGKKIVRKSAYTPCASAHIDNIYSNCQKLSALYENTSIRINECKKHNDFLEFEHLEGQTLEQKADLLLSKKQYSELSYVFQEFVTCLKNSSKMSVFVPTEQFKSVFGDISFPCPLETLEISNVDCTLSNVFVQDGKWTLIDYEWIFDFPVPFLYIVYRMIWSYLMFRCNNSLGEIKLLRLMGIDEELEACFFEMEQNFQKYVSGKTNNIIFSFEPKPTVTLSDMIISHNHTVPALSEHNNCLNEQINQANAANSELANENKILNEHKNQLETQIESLKAQIDNLTSKCADKDSVCLQLTEENAALNDNLWHLQQTIRNAIGEAYSLANTKLFKLLHLVNRFKMQFLKGRKDDRKLFFKWLRKRGHTYDSKHTYNPLFNIVHILEAYKGLAKSKPVSANQITPPEAVMQNDVLSYSDCAADFKDSYNKYDIIMLSVIDFNFRHQRPQHFAEAMAKQGHRVFYVEALFNSDCTSVTKKSDNLWIVNIKNTESHTIHPTDLSKNLDDITKEFDSLIYKYCIKDCVVMVGYPTWVNAAEQLKTKYGFKLLADYMDDYAGFQDTDGNLAAVTCKKLLKISDHIISSSDYLSKAASKYSNSVSILRNGTEYKHFAVADKTIKKAKKIVGYYGAIAHWFDFEKVIYAANKNPDADFVLIGEVTEGFDLLKKVPNIKLPGEIPYKDLPEKLAEFDVAIIPFDTSTDLIKATNPVKFYEYLSACKKVVATDIPELYPYKDKLCYLAATKEEFSDFISLCLAEKDTLCGKTEMIEFAKQNDWSARAAVLEDTISSMFPNVSIVVLTYNNLEYNKLCIDSILNRTAYPNYELIIVDNMSTDETPAYLKSLSHPKIKVILNNENLGFAGGNNVGIKAATGKYVMLLNNDTVVTAGYITNMVKHLEQDGLKMVGPVTNSIGNESMINVDYKDFSLCHRFSHRYSHTNMNLLYTDINVLAMFCVMFEKALTEEIGLLDDSYEIGMFEDDDYSMAIRKKGYKLACCEDAFIHHFGSISFKALSDEKYKVVFEKNKAYFETKWNEKFTFHKYRDTYVIPEE